MRSSRLSLLLFLAGFAAAQTIDTGILGVVKDPPGAVIGGAVVTIIQPATGFSRSVTDGTEPVRR